MSKTPPEDKKGFDLPKWEADANAADAKRATEPAEPLPEGAPVPRKALSREDLVKRLEELATDNTPAERHLKACDLLLDHVGDDKVRVAFNALPRNM
jgi:hypothetical protein